MARPSRDIAIKLMAGSQLKLGDEELTYKSESKSRFVPESSLMAVKVEQKKEKDPLAQNGRAAPLSSVCLGRYNEQWASGSIGAAPNPINHKEYTPYEGRASTKVDAYKSNMILGDEVLDYRSCKIPLLTSCTTITATATTTSTREHAIRHVVFISYMLFATHSNDLTPPPPTAPLLPGTNHAYSNLPPEISLPNLEGYGTQKS
jgi:hypothetical protein